MKSPNESGSKLILQEKEKKLQGLVSELSTKNTELESFIYTISHDLKTPIVTIDGFIGALREDFGAAIPKEAESYLDYMSGAARKMGALINDLLDLSRIGRLVGKRSESPFRCNCQGGDGNTRTKHRDSRHPGRRSRKICPKYIARKRGWSRSCTT